MQFTSIAQTLHMLSNKNNEIYYSVQFKICPNTSIAEIRSKANQQNEIISIYLVLRNLLRPMRSEVTTYLHKINLVSRSK